MSTKQNSPRRADFAIIVAKEEELQAIQEILKLEPPKNSNKRNFFCGMVQSSALLGQQHFVVCAKCQDKGNLPASLLTADIIQHWNPSCILVVGIAGGVKGREDIAVGDIVICNGLFYYEPSKQLGGKELERNMLHEPPSMMLLTVAELIKNKNIPWWKQIGVLRPDGTETTPKLLFGEILNGEKVLRDPSSDTQKKLLSRHDRALAVEMESGGVARAIWENTSFEHHPEFGIVRGISDYCNVEGGQEMAGIWGPYAARVAAAFALAIIQNTKMEVIKATIHEQYNRSFELALEKLPKPITEFKLSFRSEKNDKMPIESLIGFAINAKRAILSGPAGGGKSVIFGKLSKTLTNTNFVPILLDLKSWKEEYSKGLEKRDTLEAKLDILLGVSIADLNLEMLNAFPSNLMKFILVDGLNEVYGQDTVREILSILDEYVRSKFPSVCVLVADRLIPRAYISPKWEKLMLDYLDVDEVQRQIVAKFGKDSYDNLLESNRDLLRIPYFLDYALKSDNPYLGSRASAIRSFFTSQMGFDEPALDCLAESAYHAYEKWKSPSFGAKEFISKIGKTSWEKLLGAGAVRQANDRVSFDHQLKHDYLASRRLAKRESLWLPTSFDIVSFESNSFESLSLALEQLNPTQQNRFLKLLYDWNWLATVTCMANAARAYDRVYSSEMEVAVLALVAEKIFDPITRTSKRAGNVLAMFPEGTIAHKLRTADSIENVFDVVNTFDSREEWFVKWKTLFTRYESPPLTEKEISMISEKDSILGWTASNVIRRFKLDSEDLRQLRAYYDSFVDDALKNSIRWRVVHALGKFDAKENVDLLFQALDHDRYMWVRYGAARSLVEIAARTRNDDQRRFILGELKNRVGLFPRAVLEEIGFAVFYRGSPDSWSDQVIPILESALGAQQLQADRERWKKIVESFKAFSKVEQIS